MLRSGETHLKILFKGKAIFTGIRTIEQGTDFVNNFVTKHVSPLKVNYWEVVNITASEIFDYKPNILKLCTHPLVTHEPGLFKQCE